jgi:hypothetical protein
MQDPVAGIDTALAAMIAPPLGAAVLRLFEARFLGAARLLGAALPLPALRLRIGREGALRVRFRTGRRRRRRDLYTIFNFGAANRFNGNVYMRQFHARAPINEEGSRGMRVFLTLTLAMSLGEFGDQDSRF